MKPTETTVSLVHKKNGIAREFTPTQLDLMGKSRKEFKQADPAEAADTPAPTDQNKDLQDENAELKRKLAEALQGPATPAPIQEATDEDLSDPDPQLTALRKQYEDLTGKKPGRTGVDKLNEAITEALKAKGEGPVVPQ